MSRPGRLYTLLDAAVAGGRVEDFGALGLGLIDAQRRGLPVAESWLIPAGVFRDAVLAGLPPGHDPASLLRAIHKPSGLERAARARERLLEFELPEELSAELGVLCERNADAAFGLSIRSSATLAEARSASLAGLARVSYGVRDLASLSREIRAMWSLAVEEQVLQYLREQRLRDAAMAVVIQRSDAVLSSAVLFSREVRGAAGEGSFSMTASVGLGAPVVDGTCAIDQVRVGVDGSALARRVAHKSHAFIVADSGPRVVELDAERATAPALSDAELRRSSDLCKKLDRSRDDEYEIAFGTDHVPSIVGVRSAGGGFPRGGGPDTVWSRTGLADLLPGVPTPLSASLVEDFVESSLRKTLADLGAEIERDQALVSTVHGRYYLNVSAMVPALSGVPGIEPSVVVELLRGGNNREVARKLELGSRRGSLAGLSIAAARLLLQERRLNDEHLRFEREAEQHRRWLAEMDLAILPDDSLVTTLKETRGFLESTARMLLSCSVVALASHLALQAAVARVVPDGAARLAYALSSGVAELESARPSLALAHVAELMRADVEGAEGLRRSLVLADLPAGPGKRALQSWLEGFGERGLSELEAMHPRFHEEPTPVLEMLRAGLGARPGDPEAIVSRVRAAADAELAGLEAHAGKLEMALIRTLLGRTRALSRLRERMRVWMARTVAMTRTVALDVDRRLCRLDSSLPSGSAFFLRHSELVSASGRTRADLGALVRMRRAAHRRWLELPDPPDTFIGAPPRSAALPFDTRHASGGGACGGSVTGRARLIGSDGRGAERIEPGDVIIVRTPDVALAPLFFWGAALVAEAGSALSHAAVVAREVGMPAVFGVAGASSTYRDGERLLVDGDRGTVERLDT